MVDFKNKMTQNKRGKSLNYAILLVKTFEWYSKQSFNFGGKVEAHFNATLICLVNLICIILPTQPLVSVCALSCPHAFVHTHTVSSSWSECLPLVVPPGNLHILLQKCIRALVLLGKRP